MKQTSSVLRRLRHKSPIDIECQWWEGVLSPAWAEVGRSGMGGWGGGREEEGVGWAGEASPPSI